MKYFGILPNDFLNGEGINVSLWTAGCLFNCKGCQNQHMWNYEDGYERPKEEIIKMILKDIKANNLVRNFSVLGGEPLAPWNYNDVKDIMAAVKKEYPNIKIFVWSGYYFDEIEDKSIFDYIDVLIDGRFEIDKRDITLSLRGSSNQHILYKGKDF